jgi:hypothetical protein
MCRAGGCASRKSADVLPQLGPYSWARFFFRDAPASSRGLLRLAVHLPPKGTIAEWHRHVRLGVKSGKPQCEHMFSVVHPTTDIPANGSFAPTAVARISTAGFQKGYSALFSVRTRSSRSLIGHQASAIAHGQLMTGIRQTAAWPRHPSFRGCPSLPLSPRSQPRPLHLPRGPSLGGLVCRTPVAASQNDLQVCNRP